MSDWIPAFRVMLDDIDVTPKMHSRLISLNLTERRGDDADQLDIALDDTDGKLALPPKGAKIALQIGWKGFNLVDKGLFTVDEVEHSGAPDIVTLRARSANLIDSFKQLLERDYHDTTLGAIIDDIAKRNSLVAGISPRLRATTVKHVDQSRESDAAFLRRLGKKYDAIATVKNDKLLFIPINESLTASGKPLPLITITRDAGDQHRYHSADSDAYTGVRAFWHDERYAHRRSVVAGQAGNSKRLRTTFANELDARTAAVAEWQRLQRGLATFEMTLAFGNPLLMAQSPVVVRGFKPQIDSTEWVAVSVGHCIGEKGFTTRIEFETKTEPAEAERENEKDPDEGITGIEAHWKNIVTKKTGTTMEGAEGNVKKLTYIYSTKQAAIQGAKTAWARIREVREIIKENSDNPFQAIPQGEE